MYKLIIILPIALLISNRAVSCICEFTSHEFSIEEYEGSSHIFIAEILEENPDHITEEIYEANDLIGFKKGEDFLFTTYYSLKIIETFKGDLSNLSHLEQESITSCSGKNLMEGKKYLFHMYSNQEQPSFFSYDLCTPIEEIPFNLNADIPEKIENISSLIQNHKIQTLRALQSIQNDSIEVYFSGYYVENDSLKKENQQVNFRGKYKEGKRTGYWELFQPRTNFIYKKRSPIYKGPIKFGYFSENKKIGIWSEYRWDSDKQEWDFIEINYD